MTGPSRKDVNDRAVNLQSNDWDKLGVRSGSIDLLALSQASPVHDGNLKLKLDDGLDHSQNNSKSPVADGAFYSPDPSEDTNDSARHNFIHGPNEEVRIKLETILSNLPHVISWANNNEPKVGLATSSMNITGAHSYTSTIPWSSTGDQLHFSESTATVPDLTGHIVDRADTAAVNDQLHPDHGGEQQFGFQHQTYDNGYSGRVEQINLTHINEASSSITREDASHHITSFEGGLPAKNDHPISDIHDSTHTAGSLGEAVYIGPIESSHDASSNQAPGAVALQSGPINVVASAGVDNVGAIFGFDAPPGDTTQSTNYPGEGQPSDVGQLLDVAAAQSSISTSATIDLPGLVVSSAVDLAPADASGQNTDATISITQDAASTVASSLLLDPTTSTITNYVSSTTGDQATPTTTFPADGTTAAADITEAQIHDQSVGTSSGSAGTASATSTTITLASQESVEQQISDSSNAAKVEGSASDPTTEAINGGGAILASSGSGIISGQENGTTSISNASTNAVPSAEAATAASVLNDSVDVGSKSSANAMNPVAGLMAGAGQENDIGSTKDPHTDAPNGQDNPVVPSSVSANTVDIACSTIAGAVYGDGEASSSVASVEPAHVGKDFAVAAMHDADSAAVSNPLASNLSSSSNQIDNATPDGGTGASPTVASAFLSTTSPNGIAGGDAGAMSAASTSTGSAPVGGALSAGGGTEERGIAPQGTQSPSASHSLPAAVTSIAPTDGSSIANQPVAGAGATSNAGLTRPNTSLHADDAAGSINQDTKTALNHMYSGGGTGLAEDMRHLLLSSLPAAADRVLGSSSSSDEYHASAVRVAEQGWQSSQVHRESPEAQLTKIWINQDAKESQHMAFHPTEHESHRDNPNNHGYDLDAHHDHS